MAPRFYFHEQTEEQHTFISMPSAPGGPSFSGWGPKL